MNIGECKNKPKYVCDKCGEVIPYTYQKGFEIYKYYKQNKYDYSIKKDFDLCKSCEKKFRDWLREKPIPTESDLINKFPIWKEESYDK